MKRIGLISDTHGHLDDRIISHLEQCDEIWHAGDIGTLEVTDRLELFRPVTAVYGNIDGADVRRVFPLHQRFRCEGLNVWMTHIGGYPGRYNPQLRDQIQASPPDLFICGHSHILKVMPDKKLNLLHINPGACGIHGFHKVRTMVRFSIHNAKVSDLEVVELGARA